MNNPKLLDFDEAEKKEWRELYQSAITKLNNDKEYQAISTRSFQLGQIEATDKCVKYLLDRAAKRFVEHDDQIANIIRNLAYDIDRLCTEMRDTYNANFNGGK